MNVACCQFHIEWENKPANFATVLGLVETAELPAGTVLLLPEMFATGFSMDIEKIAETSERESEKFLADLATRFKISVLGGIVTRGPDGKGRNESVMFSADGKLVFRYQKIHPFTLAGETAHYSAGKEVVVSEFMGVSVAPFICYDLRFPEEFRAAVKKGAQFYPVIANWPLPRDAHWVKLLQARAIENQAFVAGVNRCGRDPKYVYPGRSLIVDPRGEILADGGNGEGVISANLDLDALITYRRDFPALLDM